MESPQSTRRSIDEVSFSPPERLQRNFDSPLDEQIEAPSPPPRLRNQSRGTRDQNWPRNRHIFVQPSSEIEAQILETQRNGSAEEIAKLREQIRSSMQDRALKTLISTDEFLGNGFVGQSTGTKTDYLCRMKYLTGCKARARIVNVDGKCFRIEFWERDAHCHHKRSNDNMLRISVREATEKIIRANEDISPKRLHATLRSPPHSFLLSSKEESQGKIQ